MSKVSGSAESFRTTIFVINSDPRQRERLAGHALRAGHQVVEIATSAAVLRRLAPPPRTVLVIDRDLQELPGLALIDQLHARGLFLPTLVTIPPQEVKTAVDALRLGVLDVLEQPLSAECQSIPAVDHGCSGRRQVVTSDPRAGGTRASIWCYGQAALTAALPRLPQSVKPRNGS